MLQCTSVLFCQDNNNRIYLCDILTDSLGIFTVQYENEVKEADPAILSRPESDSKESAASESA